MKCVAHQLDSRLAVPGDDHLDDIEADENIRIVEQLQPGQRPARNKLLLGRVDGFGWPPEILARARFYFHENERVIVATNDVHFATATATKIPGKNFVTFPPEKRAGQFLSPRAETKMLR